VPFDVFRHGKGNALPPDDARDRHGITGPGNKKSGNSVQTSHDEP
jgi:hypothetical protein